MGSAGSVQLVTRYNLAATVSMPLMSRSLVIKSTGAKRATTAMAEQRLTAKQLHKQAKPPLRAKLFATLTAPAIV